MANPVFCIYHGSCADGFTAAWIVRRFYQPHLVDFFPGVYQQPPPDVSEYEYARLLFVDFSYKRDVMIELAKQVKEILVIDHHVTAKQDLIDLPANVKTKIDINRSGAALTWKYFFPGEMMPFMVEHIEDRDLWRFKIANTREIMASIFSYPYDFDVWDTLMMDEPDKHVIPGAAIERKHHKDIAEMVPSFKRRMKIGGYNVPVANLPYTMSSDAGHLMAQGEPFAACYWDTPNGRVFSLRSSEDGVDVANIAKIYGGGGHRNASGFKVPFETLVARGWL